MKKVRFQSPNKIYSKMNESECQSPRPFMEKPLEAIAPPICYERPRILPYSSDPIDIYEQSNSLPVQPAKPIGFTGISNKLSNCRPSYDLELSMLDGIDLEPRQPIIQNSVSNPPFQKNYCDIAQFKEKEPLPKVKPEQICQPIKSLNDNSFFIKRDNLPIFNPVKFTTNTTKFSSCDKENNPFVSKEAKSKVEIPSLKKTLDKESSLQVLSRPLNFAQNMNMVSERDCNCYHCINVMERQMKCLGNHHESIKLCNNVIQHCNKNYTDLLNPACIQHQQLLAPIYYPQKTCNCNCKLEEKPQNAVQKKTLALEKYEKDNDTATMEIEKQATGKEKREPTVTDLFKIIKLQNEQLQLLQEKVDKFITAGNARAIDKDNQALAECIKQSKVDSDDDKISIGVMTSFEVVCTSTIINKEMVKNCDNAKIQCNRSQISIKEVISKTPINHNVLDGLRPLESSPYNDTYRNNSTMPVRNDIAVNTSLVQTNAIEDKTLNEQSLINIQVDNATTPQLSPEQTLYLDVRDYSDSDSGSDNQSNVGWTYYNKVMTHVNGMLQDSDMPSSASAMYRNIRQQCMQMHIDKTNVSVTKRVKFGEDVLITRPSNNTPPATTDTSLRMDLLAAKYLKDSARPFAKQQSAAKLPVSNDMSLATRNYMERHQLINRQGTPVGAPYTGEMPRFLDITALKQQPKLL